MKFKEIREDDNKQVETKKKPKSHKGKLEFKATVVHSSDYVSGKAKKVKAKAKEVQAETWVSTKMMWKSYALLIANYFNSEYLQNLDFIYEKLEYFNTKPKLTDKDIKTMEIIVSLNELKYYVKDNEKDHEIDINLDLIERDFFETNINEQIYKELIDESDKQYKHSISYLFRLYDLLISFVMNKTTRMEFYKAVVSQEKNEENKEHHPIVLNEKVIKSLGIKNYISNKFKKKMEYYEY